MLVLPESFSDYKNVAKGSFDAFFASRFKKNENVRTGGFLLYRII
jgi:hypothetical protein